MFLAYLIGNFPSNYLIQSKGTRIPICLAVTLTAIGAWLKCLINY